MDKFILKAKLKIRRARQMKDMERPNRIFHIFADHWDEYSPTWSKALDWAKTMLDDGQSNIRIYSVDNYNNNETEEEETEHEDCQLAIGSFPA